MGAFDFISAGEMGEVAAGGSLRDAEVPAQFPDREVAVSFDERGQLFAARLDNMNRNPHSARPCQLLSAKSTLRSEMTDLN